MFMEEVKKYIHITIVIKNEEETMAVKNQANKSGKEKKK